MILKGIIYEDFVNYKKISMYISFPYCSFKCDKEFGCQICQNGSLANTENINISLDRIVDRYINNPISEAVVMAGLEPMDSFEELMELISAFRDKTEDDIVIYTGYYKDEILDKVDELSSFKNIIIKFGRFIPYQERHYDKVLGVYLASDNQYAERVS